MKLVLVLSSIAALTGCASDLKIYDSKLNEAKGVPFNVAQLVEITSTTKYRAAKGSEKFKELCTPE